jgi:molybdate transport system substrate-binding protein
MSETGHEQTNRPRQCSNANVAVAANFTEPAREIAQLFESKTGDEAILSFGWQHAPDRMLP